MGGRWVFVGIALVREVIVGPLMGCLQAAHPCAQVEAR